MQGFAQMMLEESGPGLDEKSTYQLQQMVRSAVRLDRLIRDVLSYSKIGHSPAPIHSVDLDLLVRDIVETFPSNSPIKPAIEIKGSLHKVSSNEALLGQCVSNLLSNAVKFVSPGTTPHVEISGKTVDGSVRLDFKDNGIGIAPENHHRIYRLFERIHPDTQYDGTGVGLTIVRKAAERMGAQFGFESEPGKGSNFWIQLPKA
jgi:signal transduction histidine kinase